MVMSLTPQINENGQVTLTVRPTITRVRDTVDDPNPSLCSVAIVAGECAKCLTNPVPEISIREMESVLQLISGQTAVLGGLMTDSAVHQPQLDTGRGQPGQHRVSERTFLGAQRSGLQDGTGDIPARDDHQQPVARKRRI